MLLLELTPKENKNENDRIKQKWYAFFGNMAITEYASLNTDFSIKTIQSKIKAFTQNNFRDSAIIQISTETVPIKVSKKRLKKNS